MRKLLATIVCWFLAFGLGFTFIPPSFNLLIGWLGPVFGTSLRLVLSTIFLLFADPFVYTTLIIIWAAVGFIGGLIIRKRIGSVLSMLLVYTGQFLIVGLSGFHIFDIIQKTGILQQFSIEKILTLFPPVPRGLSLNTLLNVPIAAEIIPKLPTQIESLTTDTIINILLSTVVLNIVKNIIILCISALVGCEVGKLIGKVLRPKKKGSDVGTAKVRVKSQIRNLKKIMLLMVLLILISSTSFVLPVKSQIITYTPSIGEFQAPSKVYGGNYFFLNATIQDLDGRSQFTNATIQINGTVILNWINSSNTFSELSDTNNYCVLDSSGSLRTTVNETAYKLSWKIKLAGNYTKGWIDVNSANTKVYSTDGSGSGSKDNLFYFYPVFTWYQDFLFGAVTDDGTAYVGSLFYYTILPAALQGIDLTRDPYKTAFEGASVAVLISQDTTGTFPPLISEILGNTIMSYYNLWKDTHYIFIIVYRDVDLASASARANSAASIFSSAFNNIPITSITGVPPITQTVSMGEPPITHTYTAFVYQVSGTPSPSISSLISDLATYNDGIVDFVDSAGVALGSADGLARFVGFLRPSDVRGLIGEAPQSWLELKLYFSLKLPDTNTLLGVNGIESYWLNAYTSHSFAFNFSISDLLGIKEPIRFSPQADVSTALLVTPNATISVSGIPVPVAPIVKLITTASITPQILAVIQGLTSGSAILGVTVDLKTGVITNKETGEVVDLVEALKTAFIAIMPMEIKVEKTLSVYATDQNREIVVTIKVTNKHATEPAKNVRLDDSLSLAFYPFSAKVQGDLIKEWPEIANGSSVTHMYKISLSKEGIYTFPFALVWYDYTGHRFFARSDSVEAMVRSPSFLEVLTIGIPYAWNLAVRALNMIPAVGGNGQMVLMGIVVVVVGAIAFNEYWGYRKRKKKGEKS